jgi:F-type H+-transporting ATPase subunit alpha
MIGGRLSTSVRFSRMFGRVGGARNFTALFLAGVTDSMSQFVGNLAGTAVAENSRNRGTHHQAAYDDLSKHAVAYIQMCLFLRKPAGA